MQTVAIVGATGAVGQEFATVLAQRRFPARTYRLLASPRSAGRSVNWVNGPQTVSALSPQAFDGVDLAFFSAGAGVSREYAPQARDAGALVIDNSSAFRLAADVPLVVPEINPQAARGHRGIVAVPNCSAIILCMALAPLHRAVRIRRIVVATYQAASGAGARALAELESQTHAVLHGQPARPEAFPVPCAFNVFSHNSALGPDGYNGEETKLIVETRKILEDAELAIAPTCLRVPVRRAHTEAVALELTEPLSETRARELLAAAPGVKLMDDRAANYFPMPVDASGRDEVLVGRIRSDPSVPGGRGLQLLCCGDQLRKGAALNAVQIAELLLGRSN